MSFVPDLSVVVPVYNRGELIRYTLESVQRASVGIAVELIVVDDGSEPPALHDIERAGYRADRLVRQANAGLLAARLAGLAVATGRYVQFLDSDDLVAPEKFSRQLAAMDAGALDVSYTDCARAVLDGDYDTLALPPDEPLRETTEAADFFLRVQPAPHSPIFRATWLRDLVQAPLFPPSHRYTSVAEIWFYFNGAVLPTRVARVPGPLAIVGAHAGPRLTSHWEKLGVASLEVMEAFVAACPVAHDTAPARRAVGLAAFEAWRRLPYDFSPEFQRRLLSVWRAVPPAPAAELGGPLFARLARLLGPVGAGRMLRRLRGLPYARSRTMDPAAFAVLLAAR
jgi:hypothetical protein